MAAVASFAMLAGCLNGLEQTTNNLDCLLYGGSFSSKTVTKNFTWKTTGPIAAVNWGTANAEAGSVRIVVKDAVGKVVYDGKLATGGVTSEIADGVEGSGVSKYTKTGTPGSWKVAVTMDGYTGLMGLSVQTKGTNQDDVCKTSPA